MSLNQDQNFELRPMSDGLFSMELSETSRISAVIADCSYNETLREQIAGLDFGGLHVFHSDFDLIGKLPRLKHLHIWSLAESVHITERRMKYVRKLIRRILNLPLLEELTITGELCVPELFESFGKLPRFRKFEIVTGWGHFPCSLELAEPLTKCEALEQLSLLDTVLTPDAFEKLTELAGLTELQFEYYPSLEQLLPRLQELRNLKKLVTWDLEEYDGVEAIIRQSIPPDCELELM